MMNYTPTYRKFMKLGHFAKCRSVIFTNSSLHNSHDPLFHSFYPIGTLHINKLKFYVFVSNFFVFNV